MEERKFSEEINQEYFTWENVTSDVLDRVWDTEDSILHTPDPRDSECQFEYGSTTFPWVSMFPRETGGRMSTSCYSFTYSSDQETLLRRQQDYLRNCKRFRLTIQPCYRGTVRTTPEIIVIYTQISSNRRK